MKKPAPGFYWARVRDYGRYPTVVEFCDEGGDEWFNIMNVDTAIDLAEADQYIELLSPIDAAAMKVGDEVQMLCSPSCHGRVVEVKVEAGKSLHRVAWSDGPSEGWFATDGLVLVKPAPAPWDNEDRFKPPKSAG